MIKFNCLIHKETGTVIKYEDWKEILDKGEDYSLYMNTEIREFEYDARKILFGNDFEIIYDSKFSTNNLYRLYIKETDFFIKDEIGQELKCRQEIEDKYVIEV